MRRFAFPLLLALLAGCASAPQPKPLSGAEIVAMAKSGTSAAQIIDELKRTDTVLPLSASDLIRLHEAGVPAEVLDYLQQALIHDLRWRDRWAQSYWYGPLYRGYGGGFGPCPWPYPPGVRRPYYGGPWGC